MVYFCEKRIIDTSLIFFGICTPEVEKPGRVLGDPFIHSFIISHYPRVQLPAASHYVLALLRLSFVLPSLSLFQLASLDLYLSAFYSYSSSRFVLLMNSTVCFIICGWPSNLSMFSLPFPMSFIFVSSTIQ